MSTQILIKRSTTAGSVPSTSDIATGELAINTVDKRVFTNNQGTIVELGTYPSTQAVAGNATVGGTLGVTGATTLSSGSVTGNWSVTGTLTVSTPTNTTDAARKDYVDSADALKVDKAGDSMTGELAMGSNKITGLATPTVSTDAATKGYVDAEVSAILDSAPAALDTLNELAAAINDDANFAGTVTAALGTKLNLAGGTMTGNIVMGANKVTSTATPTTADDLSRKGYVDTQDALKVSKAGDTMTGNLVMGANKVTTTANPTADDDVTRKGYVDGILGSATDSATSAAASAASAVDSANSATASAASAATATTQASAASTSATNAANSATAASGSATAAASSATAANTSAVAAAASAAQAAASYDSFDDRYLGSKASDPSVDNDGNALVTGALYFNSTSGEMKIYDGSIWIAASSASIETMEKYYYTATSGQTVFSGSDDNSRTLALTAGIEFVFLNGVMLENPTDYTATSSAITLVSGATTGDELMVIAFGNFTVADVVAASTGGTFAGAVTFDGGISGSLGVGTSNPSTPLNGAHGLVIDGNAEGDVQLRLQNNTTGKTSADGALLSIASDGTQYLWNYENRPINFGTNNSQRMALTSGGALGIGTTNPQSSRLEVAGDDNNNTLTIGHAYRTGKYTFGTSGVNAENLTVRHAADGVNFNQTPMIFRGGVVTEPNKPAFGAVRTGGHVSGAGSIVVWNSYYSNVGGHYNTANGAFTAPVAGTYYFSVWGMFSDRIAWFELLVNGVENGVFNPYQEAPSASTLSWNTVHGSIAISLQAGDYVQMRLGDSSNVGYMYGSGSNYHNGFSGFLIG